MSRKIDLSKDKPAISRRQFARAASVVAASAVLPWSANASAEAPPDPTAVQESSSQPSPAAEAQYQIIMAKYGGRLSDDQKREVRRLTAQLEKSSQTVRSFPLDNSDEPALTFRVYRKDRR
jgi:predicted Zn-dependent protease